MLSIIAQSLPDPASAASIGWVVLSLAALAVAWNQIDEWFGRRKDKPTGADVRSEAHDKFVLKRDFDAMQEANSEAHDGIFRKIGGIERGMGAKVDDMRKEMHEMELRLTKHGEERAEKTHNRINDVLAAVSNLEGRVEASAQKD